jgi:drug/metabolite transporter (DMT)-like permease
MTRKGSEVQVLYGPLLCCRATSRTHVARRPGHARQSGPGWIAFAYLVVGGSILSFTAYAYALAHLPVTTVTTYAYVNPVIAVLAGAVFLDEPFAWSEGLDAALVVGAVALILTRQPRQG